MVVGLGTGSTAVWAVRRIGARLADGTLRDIVAVPDVVAHGRRGPARRHPAARRRRALGDRPHDRRRRRGRPSARPHQGWRRGAAAGEARGPGQRGARSSWSTTSKPSPVLGTPFALPVEVGRLRPGHHAGVAHRPGRDAGVRRGDDGAPFRTDSGQPHHRRRLRADRRPGRRWRHGSPTTPASSSTGCSSASPTRWSSAGADGRSRSATAPALRRDAHTGGARSGRTIPPAGVSLGASGAVRAAGAAWPDGSPCIAVVWTAVLLVTRVAGAPAEQCPPADRRHAAATASTRRSAGSPATRTRTARGCSGTTPPHGPGPRRLRRRAPRRRRQRALAGRRRRVRRRPRPGRRRHRLRQPAPPRRGRLVGALQRHGPLETGASALYLAGLGLRREVTGDHDLDDEMHRLARFLLVQTEPRGSVLAYREPGGAPFAGVYSPFATGQVFWALALMHQQFPDEGWDEPALRIGTYLATERDGREDDMPDVSDHWAAYGLSVVAAWPDADPAHPLPDALVPLMERQSGVLGPADPLGEPALRRLAQHRSCGAATPSRPAWAASVRASPGCGAWPRPIPASTTLADALGDRATCAAGMVAARQITAAAGGRLPRARVGSQGAWFHGGLTRMDDEQHTLSAMVRSLAIAEQARPDRPGATSDLPAIARRVWRCWRWPTRPASPSASPPPGRSRRQRVAVAGIGSGIAAVALVVIAAVADPAPGRPRTSARRRCGSRSRSSWPSRRSSTSSGGCRRPIPACPGLGAGLVPVLVPLVLRPALALLALSVAADHGVAPVVVGAVLIVPATSAPARWRRSSRGRGGRSCAGRWRCWPSWSSPSPSPWPSTASSTCDRTALTPTDHDRPWRH